MLEPSNRRLLLDSLQPPSGFKLDYALGTTYSLDLIALLAAPVAFAFSDWQDRDGRPLADPIALIKAIREYADRMLLVCQAGKIYVPNQYQALLTGLEQSIAEANSPRGGSFHPKVFFLRFQNEEEVRYRFLSLSRNMTFDRSWDTSLSLDGVLTKRTNAIARNHPLGEFIEALPGMCPRGVSKIWSKRIQDMAYEIRRVDFELPLGLEELQFWPIGIGRSKEWPFPDRCDRLLIISPFLSDGQLSKFGRMSKSSQLVSRLDQLAMISPDSLKGFEKIWTIDDATQPEPSENEPIEGDVGGTQDDNEENPSESPSLSGLHAKVYVVDQGWNASIFAGSANATSSAFQSNVEFVTELRGKKSFCGVDAILGSEQREGDRRKLSTLGDLLVPYHVHPTDTPIEDSDREFERAVDDVARQIADRVLVALCEANDTSDAFRLVLRATKRRKAIQTDLVVQVRPLSLPNHQWFDVNWIDADWTRIEPITLLGLTSFFVFRVSEKDTRKARQFVLNAPLVNAPDNRHEAILRSLLSDRDHVLRLLLLLLGDADSRHFAEVLAGSATSGIDGSKSGLLSGTTLLESLMKSLHRMPEQIGNVASVINDLRKSESSRALLPDGLDEIWDPIYAVWLEAQ